MLLAGLGITTSTSTILSMNQTSWILTVLLDHCTLSLKQPPPSSVLSGSTLFGWIVLGVATHCHIDDPVDVLALWDLHGSPVLPESKAPVFETPNKRSQLAPKSCTECRKVHFRHFLIEIFRQEVDIVLWA